MGYPETLPKLDPEVEEIIEQVAHDEKINVEDAKRMWLAQYYAVAQCMAKADLRDIESAPIIRLPKWGIFHPGPRYRLKAAKARYGPDIDE